MTGLSRFALLGFTGCWACSVHAAQRPVEADNQARAQNAAVSAKTSSKKPKGTDSCANIVEGNVGPVTMEGIKAGEACEESKRGRGCFDACKSLCEVSSVVSAPQVDGSSIFVVFRQASFMNSLNGPGVRNGPFALIADNGDVIRPFAQANVIDEDAVLFEYDGKGSYAIGQTISYGASGSAWKAKALHIVPVTRRQVPALSVILGPACYGMRACIKGTNAWTWQLFDEDHDGIPEIQVGPRPASGTHRADPKVTYRWLPSKQVYVGPPNSKVERHVRVEPSQHCNFAFQAAAKYAEETKNLPVPVNENDLPLSITVH